MGLVSLIEAVMGTSVDTKGLEDGLQKIEQLAEAALQKVSGHFGAIAIGMASAVAGVVIVALEKAIHKTAEWGEEMEHLSNRMGMTATEAATLVGIMERFGIQSGVAARSIQMMAQQVRQTQEALDPFATRMGRLLGPLRDASGGAMNLGQVLDLVRQKIAGASTDTEKLQIAQSLLGVRMGGQVVQALKLNNVEWEKLKSSVQAANGDVEQAAERAERYKQAITSLEQTFRGLQIAIGSELLPTLTDFVNGITNTVNYVKELKGEWGKWLDILGVLSPITRAKQLVDELTGATLAFMEKLGLVSKGTYDAFTHMDEYRDAAGKAALEVEKQAEAAEKVQHELEESERIQKQLVGIAKEQVTLAEKARSLGFGSEQSIKDAVDSALERLSKQRAKLQDELSTKGITADQSSKIEADLAKNRIEAAELVSKAVNDQYAHEELMIKSNGAMSLSQEIELLGKKLSNERIVGDERLKLEGEIFEKRRQYTEQVVTLGRQMGIVSAQQEIDYRKQLAAEKLGQGDALGAGQELVKARDLAIKQADQVMEFTKKIRTVSLQSEIEYQKQKLNLVKGNAEQEMQILGQIADLDKQLYDRRLQYSLTYTQNAIDAYRQLQQATGQASSSVAGPKESMTFEKAANEAERARFQQARTLEDVAQHGGTDEARSKAVEQSQAILKQVEEAQQIGKSISDGMKEAADAARDVLKAASGGGEVRAPGGPNPTVGSLLSPMEGLSTEGLARGSDIPRLDTSFTDLATRVRDVLLGTIPNVQNFSNAVQAAAGRIAGITGTPLNPGIIGPGGGVSTLPTQGSGQPASGSSSPAPTVAPGGTAVQPTQQIGVGGFQNSDIGAKIDNLVQVLSGFPDTIRAGLQDQNAANAQSLVEALAQVKGARADQTVNVKVGVDDNTGDLVIASVLKQLD